MQLATYNGQPTNLGRFGQVKTGQELRLTPVEAATAKGDKRFKLRGQVPATEQERYLELSEIGHGELLAYAKEA